MLLNISFFFFYNVSKFGKSFALHCYHIFFQTYHFVTTSCKLAHTLPLTSIARRGEQSLITKEIEYHSMIELLFNWFGFSWFALLKLSTDLHVWLNTKQQNRRSDVQ